MPDTPLTQYVKSFADMHQLHDFEERAGIHEDSHAARDEAERMAYKAVFNMDVPKEFV